MRRPLCLSRVWARVWQNSDLWRAASCTAMLLALSTLLALSLPVPKSEWPPTFESLSHTNDTLQAAIAAHPPFGDWLNSPDYSTSGTETTVDELKAHYLKQVSARRFRTHVNTIRWEGSLRRVTRRIAARYEKIKACGSNCGQQLGEGHELDIAVQKKLREALAGANARTSRYNQVEPPLLSIPGSSMTYRDGAEQGDNAQPRAADAQKQHRGGAGHSQGDTLSLPERHAGRASGRA